ncbi:hypothetical protein [Albidovulum sediminis]|uniref:Short-chain dehydrogenase n=1 Tax=Albidovulum sediminis TaxID=3066345 RepID=A0ABT2NPW6_9RHOB|nr:hypothetical protein [Defluviimonas sediminis]MCT8330939.1 hypothetical protein [Defluviimonas sediminis]
MVKIVTLFLIAMAILAVFGRLRVPRIGSRSSEVRRCRTCGRPLIGKSDCDCGRGAS